MAMKRVTPKRDNHYDERQGESLWVGTDAHAFYCSGCGEPHQPRGRILRVVSGLNGCTDAEFCGCCIRRLLKELG